jgi:hypothetical protein
VVVVSINYRLNIFGFPVRNGRITGGHEADTEKGRTGPPGSEPRATGSTCGCRVGS